MVGPGECPLAHLALERPVPSVLPHVPGQLVRPGKPPAAPFPAAYVGFLARVRPLVGLQVARFGICLNAAFNGACVDDLFPLCPVTLPLWLVRVSGGLGAPLFLGSGSRLGQWRRSDLGWVGEAGALCVQIGRGRRSEARLNARDLRLVLRGGGGGLLGLCPAVVVLWRVRRRYVRLLRVVLLVILLLLVQVRELLVLLVLRILFGVGGHQVDVYVQVEVLRLVSLLLVKVVLVLIVIGELLLMRGLIVVLLGRSRVEVRVLAVVQLRRGGLASGVVVGGARRDVVVVAVVAGAVAVGAADGVGGRGAGVDLAGVRLDLSVGLRGREEGRVRERGRRVLLVAAYDVLDVAPHLRKKTQTIEENSFIFYLLTFQTN